MILQRVGPFGLGLGEAPSTAQGYCLENGTWRWTTAAQCPTPLQPGGPPISNPGFCWIRQTPPDPFPGFWQRARAGQPCAFEPPPSPPTGSSGIEVRDQRVDTWTRSTIDLRLRKMLGAWQRRRDAVAVALTATGQLKPCRDVAGVASNRADRNCELENEAYNLNMRLLDPIGVIVELGVPFAPTDLERGMLEKTYTPNSEQRFLADLMIYAQSQRSVAIHVGTLARNTSLIARAKKLAEVHPNFWRTNIWTQLADMTLQSIIDATDFSVSEFMQRARDPKFNNEGIYTLTPEHYSLNSIQPTPEELTGSGGLKAFYRRGGFLIAKEFARGSYPVAAAYGAPTWNTGYCACQGNFPPMALHENLPFATGVQWDYLITVGPQYTLVVRPQTTSGLTKAISKLASVMKKLAGFLCQNRPLVQQVNQDVLLKEICMTPANVPCTRGTPDCTCTPPTSVQQATVAVANAGLNKWCERVEPWVTPKPAETPFNPPPPESTPWSPPWWLVAIAGIAAGGALAARRSRRA